MNKVIKKLKNESIKFIWLKSYNTNGIAHIGMIYYW